MTQPTTQNSLTVFRDMLTRREPDFAAALNKSIPAAKFTKVIMTAVLADPALMRVACSEHSVERTSLLTACMKAAADGLLPDGREGVITVYNTNIAPKGAKMLFRAFAQWNPMVRGIYKKLRESGAVKDISGRVVREGDEFHYELGDNEHIKHVPNLGLEPDLASIKFAYAIAHLPGGGIEREVMTVSQIEKARAKSKAPRSLMWIEFYDQACIKTVVRRLSKRLNVDWIWEEEEASTAGPLAAMSTPPPEPEPDEFDAFPDLPPDEPSDEPLLPAPLEEQL